MKNLDHKKLVGLIVLSLLLTTGLTAQSGANRVLPHFNDNEVITAIISSAENGSHKFSHMTSNQPMNSIESFSPAGEDTNKTEHDTVRYLIIVDATDHLPSEKAQVKPSSAPIHPTSLESDLELDPVTAINSIFKVHSILFEYRESRLTKTAMHVLDKVAYVMLKHPNALFELGAHTDARGVYADNMVLSKERMQSAVKYLTSKGVNEKQLVAVAYGEEILKNVCDSDSHCSEEVHAGNRRVEINVISVGK